GIEPDVNRTRNLLIWSQTRYHCATDPTGSATEAGNNFTEYMLMGKQKKLEHTLCWKEIIEHFTTKLC
ncbi:hypothetical protein CY35_07G095400, partial [Sphagnum magellanicum]